MAEKLQAEDTVFFPYFSEVELPEIVAAFVRHDDPPETLNIRVKHFENIYIPVSYLKECGRG